MRGQPLDPVAAVAGLARELEALQARVCRLTGLPARVEQLSELLARLTATVSSPPTQAGEATATWLAGDLDLDAATRSLTELTEWLHVVYLRYSDAARGFPHDCWPWHPDVVEELVWLRAAWMAAYSADARVSAAADWHDRYRPGVAKRISDYARRCSIQSHQPPVQDQTAPAKPPAEAVHLIAQWWTTDRRAPAPEAPNNT